MKKGFTIIELLIVIAILGILAAGVLLAINPGKRAAQARDSIRKSDISQIANALVEYQAIVGRYPAEQRCDSSIGSSNSQDCNLIIPQSGWATGPNDYIYQALVVQQQILKKLPVDPVNNLTRYYKYEPSVAGGGGGNCSTSEPNCNYWIGTLLESPKDSTKAIYRCSDNNVLTNGTGCKEVTGTSLAGSVAP